MRKPPRIGVARRLIDLVLLAPLRNILRDFFLLNLCLFTVFHSIQYNLNFSPHYLKKRARPVTLDNNLPMPSVTS